MNKLIFFWNILWSSRNKFSFLSWYLYKNTVRTYAVNLLFRVFFKGIWLHRQSRQIRFFPRKRRILLHTCGKCSELPSNISTMLASHQNIRPVENVPGADVIFIGLIFLCQNATFSFPVWPFFCMSYGQFEFVFFYEGKSCGLFFCVWILNAQCIDPFYTVS